MKITVAGVGYVGLSLAVLLAQNHEVTAITTTESKAEKLNRLISPTITHPSVMVGTACPRTQNNSWQITRMCRRI